MAAGRGKYSLNDSKPAFSLLDDDDMTSEFLNTSSATFLASDRLPPGPERQAAIEAETRRQEVLQQMKQLESRTLQSSKNSIMMLNESEKVGLETAEELVKQREQLNNTEKRLDGIMGNLKDTQKNINGIKSVFSSLKNWWATPKKDPQADSESKEPSEANSPTEPNDLVSKNPHLGPAYSKSQASVTAQMATTHPTLRLRGFDEEEDENVVSQDFQATANKVNNQLDADLDEMSVGLTRLRGLAMGLGTEITDQNAMIDRIHDKANRADDTIGSQNTQMKKLLKR